MKKTILLTIAILLGQIVSINATESRAKSTIHKHSYLAFSPLQKFSNQKILVVNNLNLIRELKAKKDTSSTLERKELKKDRQAGVGKGQLLRTLFGSFAITSLLGAAFAWAIYPISDFDPLVIRDAKLFLVIGLICFMVFLILFIKKKIKSAKIRKSKKVIPAVH